MTAAEPVSPVPMTTDQVSQAMDKGGVSSDFSTAPIGGQTLADVTASPAGQAFMVVLQEAIGLQMANECKRHNEHLLRTMKEARREAG